MKSAKDIEQTIRKLTVESGDRIHNRILNKLLMKLTVNVTLGLTSREESDDG